MLFQIETSPTHNDRLIKKFSEHCDKYPIVQCYKNKLYYKCKYNIEVENIIKEIEKNFIDQEQLPWWLDIID